jgi:hypothetical protein
MSDDYFIKLSNSSDFERGLLETSKETISIIDLQKKLELLRDEKHQAIYSLQENLKDVKKLLGHLETMIPKSEIPKQKIKTIKNENTSNIEKELDEIDREMDALKKGKKK